MNKFLLRGLLSATVCLVAGSAFAQTTETATIGVSNDVTLRKDAADKTFATNTDLELYTLYTGDVISTDFIGAMSFDLPSKPGYAIKSATLRLVTERYKGSATLSIYSLGNNAVSDADTYNSQRQMWKRLVRMIHLSQSLLWERMARQSLMLALRQT